MITLYTFGPFFGLRDASPFVMKGEMLLKVSGLLYQTSTRGFTKAPKGKLPYIDDDGTVVADSTLIRLHLEQRHGTGRHNEAENNLMNGDIPDKQHMGTGLNRSMRPARIMAALLALTLATFARADGASDTRAAFLAVIERPHVAAKAELADLPAVQGLRKQHLWFQSDATERVPGYLLFPDATAFPGKRPVVIALHGTGGSKDDMSNILSKAARAGFIGVAIDGRYHGERTRAGGGSAEYEAAIARAFETGQGHPFYYDTVWDVMRLIDYLSTRKDVDAARIGLTGISKGGIEAYFTAAADPRVAAAVPYIGVQSFKWALDNGQWKARVATIQDAFNQSAASAGKSIDSADFVRQFYARVVPGIDGQFDGPQMLASIAPRPLLVINSDSDANTPIAGVRLAVRTAQPAYAAAGAPEKLKLIVQEDTPHRVNPESADAGIAWFVQWLKP